MHRSREASIEYRAGRLFLDGEDVEAELRSAPVDALVAQLSAIPELRDIVNAIVRGIAGARDAVVEGRDMTTVVFPDADAKFYLDASAEARAMPALRSGSERSLPRGDQGQYRDARRYRSIQVRRGP